MALKNALQEIKDLVVDLATLEVETYTGDLSAKTGSEQDWKSFTALIREGNATAGGDFHLRLYTYIGPDGDTRLYRSQEDPPQGLIDTHTAAVKAGIETRASIIALFRDLVGWSDD